MVTLVVTKEGLLRILAYIIFEAVISTNNHTATRGQGNRAVITTHSHKGSGYQAVITSHKR